MTDPAPPYKIQFWIDGSWVTVALAVPRARWDLLSILEDTVERKDLYNRYRMEKRRVRTLPPYSEEYRKSE